MINEFSDRIDKIPSSGIRTFFDLVENAKDIISLGVGEPDFSTPWFIRDEAIYALEKGYTTYTSNLGLLELRKAIASYVERLYAVSYNIENEILVTNGVSEAVDLIFRSILNAGDEVILPTPMYVCYQPLITLAGGTVVPCNMADTGFSPDPDRIASLITKKTKAIVLCYPHNPTGMSISKSTLKKIAELAEKHDLWVISDEIYAELQFEPGFVSFANLPKMKKRTVLLNGLSKSHAMTGWRVGFMCAPKELVSRCLKIHQYAAMCVSSASQYAAAEALKHGDSAVTKMRKSYHQRAQLFTDAMNDCGLSTMMPDGGLYCFPDIRKTGLSSLEFATKLLHKHKVAVVPGTAFGEEGEGYVRCCIATQLNDLMKAAKRIQSFVKDPA